jgi:hypothetical protein
MSYYPILYHAPKGRDEGEEWQLWIRRHDELRKRDAYRRKRACLRGASSG